MRHSNRNSNSLADRQQLPGKTVPIYQLTRAEDGIEQMSFLQLSATPLLLIFLCTICDINF